MQHGIVKSIRNHQLHNPNDWLPLTNESMRNNRILSRVVWNWNWNEWMIEWKLKINKRPGKCVFIFNCICCYASSNYQLVLMWIYRIVEQSPNKQRIWLIQTNRIMWSLVFHFASDGWCSVILAHARPRMHVMLMHEVGNLWWEKIKSMHECTMHGRISIEAWIDFLAIFEI